MANRALIDAQPDGRMGAGFSNADRDFYKEAGPNINNTKEGNRAIVRMNLKIEERKQLVAQMARDYRKKHGQLDEGYDQALANFTENNPVFKDVINDVLPHVGGAPPAPTAPPPAAGSDPGKQLGGYTVRVKRPAQ